ncbi:MAG: hypothetical protein OXC70_05225 [Gammaproteobacteria bacterium]|nr:hypothetical protein [Gammaproteobacteria bacterium]
MSGGLTDPDTPGGGAQRAFYDRGIGTYGNWFREVENAILASLDEGDRVVVFGFRRGSTLARKFAPQILDDNEDESRKIAFPGVVDTAERIDLDPEYRPVRGL